MRYTITIKDNENGKITKEIKANAIIIGFANGENCGEFKALEATNIEAAGAIWSAKKAIKDITSKFPETELLTQYLETEKFDD